MVWALMIAAGCCLLTGCPPPMLPALDCAVLDTLQGRNQGKLGDVRARLLDHEPGELALIYVKAAFPVNRRGVRDEYLWVQVVRWDDKRVEGILVNEPEHCYDLHAGMFVQFAPERVIDYQENLADGQHSGNALQALMDGSLIRPSDLSVN